MIHLEDIGYPWFGLEDQGFSWFKMTNSIDGLVEKLYFIIGGQVYRLILESFIIPRLHLKNYP